MKKEITLCFDFLSSQQQIEVQVDEDLTLQEVFEGLQQLCPESVTKHFNLSQPVILCRQKDHHYLDQKKAIAQLRLLDGELILVY